MAITWLPTSLFWFFTVNTTHRRLHCGGWYGRRYADVDTGSEDDIWLNIEVSILVTCHHIKSFFNQTLLFTDIFKSIRVPLLGNCVLLNFSAYNAFISEGRGGYKVHICLTVWLSIYFMWILIVFRIYSIQFSSSFDFLITKDVQ